MKITLAGTLAGAGGVQSHLRWMLTALAEEKIESQVLHLGPVKCSQIDRGNFLRAARGENVQFVFDLGIMESSGSSRASRLKKIKRVRSALKSFSPDIYYAVGTGWILIGAPLLLPQKPKLIFHEVASGVAGDWHDPRWIVQRSYDEVLSQSPQVGEAFAKTFRWTKPIISIPAMPEPLELTALLPSPTPHVIKLGTAKAALFSRLVPHKQALWLVHQWDYLSDVLGELHIHGTGPEEQLIHDYIKERNLGERIKCCGRYPEGQAYVDLMGKYDFTLLPTVGAEGAPLVLLESMACGIPFVAHGVGGIVDYANPDCIIVPPTGQNFVGAVREMAERLANGQIRFDRLQQLYLKNYSFDVLKRKLLAHLCQ